MKPKCYTFFINVKNVKLINFAHFFPVIYNAYLVFKTC